MMQPRRQWDCTVVNNLTSDGQQGHPDVGKEIYRWLRRATPLTGPSRRMTVIKFRIGCPECHAVKTMLLETSIWTTSSQNICKSIC